MRRLIEILLATLLVSGCADHYRIRDSVVEFVDWRAFGSERATLVVPEADPSSFQELSEWWGKDRERVFWQTQVTEGANPESFRVINNYYGLDDNSAFFAGAKLPGSDATTFEYLGNNWSRDEENFYYGYRKLNVCDLDSFRIIEEFSPHRAIDNECYYFEWRTVAVREFSSLEVLAGGFARDDSAVYWGDLIIENADPDSFEVIEGTYVGKDRNRCYSTSRELPCSRMAEEFKETCGCGGQ